jgi:hypothetical protein
MNKSPSQEKINEVLLGQIDFVSEQMDHVFNILLDKINSMQNKIDLLEGQILLGQNTPLSFDQKIDEQVKKDRQLKTTRITAALLKIGNDN